MKPELVGRALGVVSACLAAWPFIGLPIMCQFAHTVYVDEPALLAGYARPDMQHKETMHGSAACDAIGAEEQLVERLTRAFASERVTIHDITAGEGRCSCTSVSATVRSQRSDGTEAILLAFNLGAHDDVRNATTSRPAELAMSLAATLREARWLTKDVIFLLHPTCSCACEPRSMACPHAPVRRFLEEYHLTAATDASDVPLSQARPSVQQAGLLRQVITITYEEPLPGKAMHAQQGEIMAELHGVGGRLPNLDVYSTIWKIAQHSDVRVPVAIPAAGGVNRGAGRVVRALRFMLALALGEPRGEHAAALAMGVDAISLSARGMQSDDAQLQRLLLGTVRSFSNLEEALHHSHYTYVLLDANTLLPLKLLAPGLLLPALASLLLRGWGVFTARPRSMVDALSAVLMVHAAGFALVVAPGLSPYMPCDEFQIVSASLAPMVGVVLLHMWWLFISSTLALLSWRRPHTLSLSQLAVAACLVSICVATAYTCHAIHLGHIGAALLAAMAAIGLPSYEPPRSKHLAVRLIVEVLTAVALSPLSLLCCASDAAGASALLPLGIVSKVWHGAAIHRTLPYAFACVGIFPMSAIIGAMRLRRIASLLRLMRRMRRQSRGRSEMAMPNTHRFEEALRVARKLPKCELHMHLDGSLLPSFIAERAAARGVETPGGPRALREFVDAMKAAMRSRSSDARVITAVGAKKNWPIFDYMNQFLQTTDELIEATKSLCMSLRLDHNVWYCELRFCPALHTREGLSEAAVVRAVVTGFARARDEVGIRGGVILCALRSYPAPHPLDMARLARDWLGHGVVGFDVAGSENYALTQPAIRDALEACSQWGVPTTVHAGELPKGMVGNLEEALEMKVHRIGHGAGLCHGDALEQGIDRHLLASAAENDTVIEVCLTAICTSSRVPSYAAHPIRRMLDAGLCVCLSCDNLTLSGDPATAGGYPLHAGYSYAYPSGELAHLVADCGVSWSEARQVVLNGIRAAFPHGGATPTFVAEFEAEVNRVLLEHFGLQ